MTCQSNPNPKKLKIDSELKDDGRVTITTSTTSQDATYGTLFEDDFFSLSFRGKNL